MFIKENNNRKSKSLNRKLKESRSIELLSWDELTEEQQDYVIKNWHQVLPSYIVECYNESVMDLYYTDVEYLADNFENKYGLNIDTKKIYWESNSQGPYPEWKLEEVFPTIDNIFNGINYELSFYSGGMRDPEKYYTIDIFNNKEQEWEIDLELADLKGMPDVPEALISDLENKVNGAQEFIDTVWRYINDVCTSYPDEEWIEDFLIGNPDTFDFYIKDNGNVAVFE